MDLIKRIGCLFVTAALLGSVLCFPAFAADDLVYGIGFVDATGLRLRSGPSIG